MILKNLKKNISFFTFLLILSFFCGRYVLAIRRQFLLEEDIESILLIINAIAIVIILLQLKVTKFVILYLGVVYFFYFAYAGFHELSLSVMFSIIISIYIAQKSIFNIDLLDIVVYSGLIFCCFLFYLLFFVLNQSVSFLEIRDLNYIAGAVFIFTLICLFKNKNIFALLGIILLILLKARTSLLSILVFIFLKYYKNIKFYILFGLFLLLFQYFVGLDTVIHKWEDTGDISSNRIDNGIAYIGIILEKFPASLMPYWLIDFEKEMLMIYDINIENKSVPHNLIIDIILHEGIILGLLNVMLFFVPCFMIKNTIRYAYISLLCFGFFEPSLTYGTSIICIVFFFFNYNVLKKIFYA